MGALSKTQPLLSSLSESEADSKRVKKKEPARRRGRPSRRPHVPKPVPSDSDDEPPAPPRVPRAPYTPPVPRTPDSDSPPYVPPARPRGRPPRTPPSPPPVKPKRETKSPVKVKKEPPEKTPKKRGRRKQVPKPPPTYSESEEEVVDKKKAVKRAPSSSESENEAWGFSSPVKKRPLKESSVERKKPHETKREEKRPKRISKPTVTSDSSEDEIPTKSVSLSPIKPVSRVPPAPPAGKRAPRSFTPESEPETKKEESPPKLDFEGNVVADKKKNDTLRRLFSIGLGKRDGETGGKGGKGGGKGGKGGKCGGKGGKGGKGTPGVIVECNSERTLVSPLRDRSPSPLLLPPPIMERIPSLPPPSPVREPKTEPFPSSLMCRIDISRLNHIPSKRRSVEVRTRTENPDTRQGDKKSKKSDKHKSRSEKRKKCEIPPQFEPPPVLPVVLPSDNRKWQSPPHTPVETETTSLPRYDL